MEIANFIGDGRLAPAHARPKIIVSICHCADIDDGGGGGTMKKTKYTREINPPQKIVTRDVTVKQI